jgi:hypothetical protein
LQLQLSEVIIRSRRFYQEVTGLKGFVLEGQVTIFTRVARCWCNIPKRGKYTKMGKNIPNGQKMNRVAVKIDRMAIKYTYQHLSLQVPPKFTQIRIFGKNAIWQT